MQSIHDLHLQTRTYCAIHSLHYPINQPTSQPSHQTNSVMAYPELQRLLQLMEDSKESEEKARQFRHSALTQLHVAGMSLEHLTPHDMWSLLDQGMAHAMELLQREIDTNKPKVESSQANGIEFPPNYVAHFERIAERYKYQARSPPFLGDPDSYVYLLHHIHGVILGVCDIKRLGDKYFRIEWQRQLNWWFRMSHHRENPYEWLQVDL